MLDRERAAQSTSDQQIRLTPHLGTRTHPDTLPPLRLPTSSDYPTYTFPPPPSSHSETHVKLQREARDTTSSIFATQSKKRPRTSRSPTSSIRLTHPSSPNCGGLAPYSPSPQALAPPKTMLSVYPSRDENPSCSKHADAYANDILPPLQKD